MFKESKKIHQFLPNLQYRATDCSYDQLAYALVKCVEKLNHVIIKWECWC